MSIRMYRKEYIACYNLVIDITKDIKDFFYPNVYTFIRIDKSLSLKSQMGLIRKDLENMKFEKEVCSDFMKELESCYCEDEEGTEEFIDELQQYLKPRLNRIKDKIENNYLPFIRTIEVEDYKDTTNDKLSDEETWNLILKDKTEVRKMEAIIEDMVWALMDDSKEDIAENFLKDYYKLTDIEFARYMNGINNSQSSIIKKEDDEKKISANFKLFDHYFKDIFGQDKAIEKIRKTLLRSILFYNSDNIDERIKEKNQGPLATFMFYGPTGTGKTETAKKIADFVYGDSEKMLILDMNSYKDSKVSASAIKGHPEGYVDSSKGTDFTRFLQKNKTGIIVLDEFEKSSYDVRELFMTMLDEGTFKDALGNVYDLSGYIFVATTNVSEVFENKTKRIGFQTEDIKKVEKDEEERIRDELRSIFTAPIMNRFNNIVGFNEIKKEHAILICKNLISKIINKFESKKFGDISPKIKISNIDKIVDIVLEESDFKKDGVRSLKNVINDIIASQILEEIVEGNGNIIIDSENNEIKVSKNIKTLNKRIN